jgi:hypothetical protein
VHMQDRAVGPIGAQAAMLSDVFEVLVDGRVHSQAGGLRLDVRSFGLRQQAGFGGTELD